MKPTHALNDKQIERTRKVWQQRLGHELSRDGARQFTANMTGFFSVLAEWSYAESPTPAKDAPVPSALEPAEARHDH
jgi:hypothetical protein